MIYTRRTLNTVFHEKFFRKLVLWGKSDSRNIKDIDDNNNKEAVFSHVKFLQRVFNGSVSKEGTH